MTVQQANASTIKFIKGKSNQNSPHT